MNAETYSRLAAQRTGCWRGGLGDGPSRRHALTWAEVQGVARFDLRSDLCTVTDSHNLIGRIS